MYYIVNETNQIIAADESLLTLCGFTHINELSSNITLENITLNILSDNQLVLTQNNHHHTFPITRTSLSSFLGQLTLITLNTEKQTSASDTVEDIDIDSLIIQKETSDDTINVIDDFEEEIEIDTEEKLFDLSLKETQDLDNHTLYGLTDTKDDVKEEETLDIPLETTIPVVDDAFTLLDTREEISPKTEIIIDIAKVSEEIGVSKEDFNLFLNEYIDTSLDLEKDLKSSDDEIRSSAIQTLLHLSEVLHLDVFDEILKNIHTSLNDTRTASVTSFYDALSRITTSDAEEISHDTSSFTEEIKSNEESQSDDDIILFDLGLTEDKTPEIETVIENIEVTPIEIQQEKKLEQKEKTEEEKTNIPQGVTSFGEIDLSKVEAIHFDFQLSAAADELSLPESLIEEFMIDFVEQAHLETDKMLIAYKKGDLETINKIGHLLKGVSSNLRITTLSDTLYQIQFCEEPNDLENLIKDYWGHFLFFEKQINMLSN